jgi:hypothetical protein
MNGLVLSRFEKVSSKFHVFVLALIYPNRTWRFGIKNYRYISFTKKGVARFSHPLPLSASLRHRFLLPKNYR